MCVVLLLKSRTLILIRKKREKSTFLNDLDKDETISQIKAKDEESQKMESSLSIFKCNYADQPGVVMSLNYSQRIVKVNKL